MRKAALTVLMLVGIATPAVAQAPAQWWDCGHRTAKGKTYFVGICTASADTAFYTATERLSKKVYKGKSVAQVTCEPTHVPCVEAN